MIKIFTALVLISISSAVASTQSPYAGEEKNEIKSLSLEEIKGLLQGEGMGFAKAAELNNYPGPRHVLDLANELNLSDRQIAETNKIFETMRESAIHLGGQLVEFESQLDKLFSSSEASPSKMNSLLSKIGGIRAKLRGTHLHAHLQMKEVLSRHQVMMYGKLRGYSNANHSHKHSH
jgi:Spy/CpxP family protein refolding chaperone